MSYDFTNRQTFSSSDMPNVFFVGVRSMQQESPLSHIFNTSFIFYLGMAALECDLAQHDCSVVGCHLNFGTWKNLFFFMGAP